MRISNRRKWVFFFQTRSSSTISQVFSDWRSEVRFLRKSWSNCFFLFYTRISLDNSVRRKSAVVQFLPNLLSLASLFRAGLRSKQS